MNISYVIPTYNCSSNLAITIQSVLDQRIEHHQVIVVDDHSTDGPGFLRSHYQDDVIWITNSKRRGAAYSRNVGNEMATGDVIAVCDAGDFYPKNRSSELVKFFKNLDNDLFYSDVQINQPGGRPLFVQKAQPWDGKGKPPISHTTVAYRNSAPKYHEKSVETDLYEFFLYDCLKSGMNFGYVNKTLCVKVDLSSSPSYRNVKKAKDLKYKMYQEYGQEIERANV